MQEIVPVDFRRAFCPLEGGRGEGGGGGGQTYWHQAYKRDCPNKKKWNKTHKAKNVTCEEAEDSSESAFIAKEVNQDKMVQQNEWLIDSGASKHMTCHEEILQNYQQFPRPQSVKLGDGRVVDALGFGPW